jgi:hypothetical protein
MSKIQEVVSIKSGYANFVELKSAFEESQENADRMAMYRPTKSHREAFEKITRGLFQPNDKKFYLLSGSYGTGKSHLCLMTANFLSRSSEDPALAEFYKNYEKLAPEKAKDLKTVRKNGQHLVAICDYHSGRRFEDVVLKAVFEACKAKGLDPEVETEFDEAERLLSSWEEKGDTGIRNFYQDFERALERVSPGMTLQSVRAGLREYDSSKMKMFRETYREVMGGTEFQAQSGNLIPIVQKLVHSESFKERFRGLAIFFDEFNYALEKANYSKDVLHGFMETICKNEPNVMFVGCIHKDFRSYADRLSKEDASVMYARVNQVDLLNEGIEEIIGAIVETDKESEAWRQEVEPKTAVFDQLLPKCRTLNLFPWIESDQRIRQRVLEDIYGVHPAALSCLLTLSSEIGSDARSTFTFFSSEGTGSYGEFIQNNTIEGNDGKLQLYTVDKLVTFFKSELSPGNSDLRENQRHTINGFQASVDALRKANPDELAGLLDDRRMQVLNTVLIYRLCGIPASAENISFGMYSVGSNEKKLVKRYLEELRKCGALFYRQQSETYELASGVGEDPYDLIERFMEDTSLHPQNLFDEFLREAAGKNAEDFVEAKIYNVQFNEDKRCKPIYVPAQAVDTSLWSEIRDEWKTHRNDPAKSYEGVLVYPVCENDDEIDLVRSKIRTLENEHIAVALPASPVQYHNTLLRVKACKYYLSPQCPQKIAAQTEIRLREILDNQSDGFFPQLKRMFEQVSSGADACWYTAGNQVLVDTPQQPHEPATKMAEHLFSKRCRIKHPDLNFVHDDKWKKGKNTALKQAVEVLLQAEKVFVDSGNPENHGEKRYLQKVLFSGAGALKKTGNSGNVAYFRCEESADKIHDNFPVLKELAQQISDVDPGKTFELGSFLNTVKEPPYGAGGTQIILAIAHIVRAYGERLLAYTDTTQSNEQSLGTYENLVEIVQNPAPQTVLKIRSISQAQKILIDSIAQTLNAPALNHGEERTVKSVYELLVQWWRSLPRVSGIVTLYYESAGRRISKLKDVLAGAPSRHDSFHLLLEEIPFVYIGDVPASGVSEADVEKIAEDFASDVSRMEAAQEQVEQMLVEQMHTVFDSSGDIISLEQTVKDWFSHLSPRQRDPGRYEGEEAYALVCSLLKDLEFRKVVNEHLPTEFGFGPVHAWTSLHLQDYKAKLAAAKVEVEQAKVEIPAPKIEESEIELQAGETRYITVPDGVAGIAYTTDGSEPKASYGGQRSESDINLAELLKESPNVKVKMRTYDREGNYSDLVTVKVTDKARKYEVQLNKDNSLYNANEAYFTVPEDPNGLVTVMKSILRWARERNIISAEKSEYVEKALDSLKSEDS